MSYGKAFLLIAALSVSTAFAQDKRVSDLFPGVKLTVRPLASGLYASTYSRIESGGKEYIALTYYQPYPNSTSLRYVSYALLERIGAEYRVRLDHVAADGAGSGVEYEKPFLYAPGEEQLVVFSTCYRGCKCSFFRLGAKPIQVSLQQYDGLARGESFTGRGDIYHFDPGGLSVTYKVARSGDAACCPSGGTTRISYALQGNQFRVAGVERRK